MRPYKLVSGLSPKGYRTWVATQLNYSNLSVSPENYIGFSLLYGLTLAFTVAIVMWPLNFAFSLIQIAAMTTFVLFQVFMHSVLVLVADSRRKFVEEVLPDFLQLMASNIRSGLTPDKALLVSARDEFGPLEVEVKRAAKRVLTGETLEAALASITRKINSVVLKRTINLINEGIKKGGELALLLEETADDIRNTRILRKEVSALVLMYAIFIFFAAVIGAPLLYAISTFLVETMSKVGSLVDVKDVFVQRQAPLSFGGLSISTEFLQMYSLAALTITSIFAGLLIGLIQEGREMAGIKLIPILFLLSVGVFFMARVLTGSVFGGLFS